MTVIHGEIPVPSDGCEVRLCDPCARVRPCVPCVSRLPPVFLNRSLLLCEPLYVLYVCVSPSWRSSPPRGVFEPEQ